MSKSYQLRWSQRNLSRPDAFSDEVYQYRGASPRPGSSCPCWPVRARRTIAAATVHPGDGLADHGVAGVGVGRPTLRPRNADWMCTSFLETSARRPHARRWPGARGSAGRRCAHVQTLRDPWPLVRRAPRRCRAPGRRAGRWCMTGRRGPVASEAARDGAVDSTWLSKPRRRATDAAGSSRCCARTAIGSGHRGPDPAVRPRIVRPGREVGELRRQATRCCIGTPTSPRSSAARPQSHRGPIAEPTTGSGPGLA